MKHIGLALITISFIGGAYVSVLDAREVMWEFFAICFVGGFIGVAMARIATKKAATTDEVLTTNLGAVRESLKSIVDVVDGLRRESEHIGTYEMGAAIDDRAMGPINRFVESRESISHVFGLQAYADVMSHFAGGERYLNRVWSASADGYVNEVNEYLGRSLELFETALRKLEALEPPRKGW